ncbi:MAG: peptide-methionine (S)-S-oxide reductase [Candidatus Magasanikbacteria bacterium RIFOXYD2_FULL_39_9]|uniref:Peptide methionine sulfoxide reductase MsrA n=1 Tax=Candidatus Magasanikbacteria bacterium RIFOXYD1_FULL_40_23 TaxID=1798705 RepID=A0A1F6PBU7_9BACT|nr:MAG: peptide-methionine (S)-S-oxide reductase [Candidatus Magasanikbacteria bacterium RIFOXYD2_FULL_39_9]OGH93443.1 MAG: peptide-methionine (S)-S-oxide reductase [Candidatus Magasanikbacteria bacterium RIFOXYD1_FULL_40_23]
METIILGGGCFWCLEAAYSRIKGVESVVSGYAGGSVSNPSYEQVCGGGTGHAEVVKITYNPVQITLEDILHIFFVIHNPTTLNRQGNDIGTQYRSVIFYENETQKEIAEKIIKEINEEKVYDDEVVTELKPVQEFYSAEEYHQKYFAKNPTQAYCQAVIEPKLAKLRQKYSNFYK